MRVPCDTIGTRGLLDCDKDKRKSRLCLRKSSRCGEEGEPACSAFWCTMHWSVCAWTRLSSRSGIEKLLREPVRPGYPSKQVYICLENGSCSSTLLIWWLFSCRQCLCHMAYMYRRKYAHILHALIRTPLSLLPEQEGGNTRRHRTALLYDRQDPTNRYHLTLALFSLHLPSWHWASIATRQTMCEQTSLGWQWFSKSSLAFSYSFHRHEQTIFSTVPLLQSNLRQHTWSTTSSHDAQWQWDCHPLSSSAIATSRVTARWGSASKKSWDLYSPSELLSEYSKIGRRRTLCRRTSSLKRQERPSLT